MNTQIPAPALENVDGIACAAIANHDLCEPYRRFGHEVEGEDQAVFYAVIAADPTPDPDPGTGTNPPRYMLVEYENRVMMLCEPCNEMVVCRNNS